MWILAAIFCITLAVSFGTDVPKVKTPNGVVVGHYKKSYNGRVYSAFEGIPYAKKPIGELRFEVMNGRSELRTTTLFFVELFHTFHKCNHEFYCW